MSEAGVVKERPILFSGPMVRAILDERKTQTRRVIHPQPEQRDAAGLPGSGGLWWKHWNLEERIARNLACPYGKPGDRLWVREAHFRYGHWEPVPGVKTKKGRMKWRFIADTTQVVFDAEEYGLERFGSIRKGRHHKNPGTSSWHKRQARFMFRRDSRITLEITEVRVQLLQDIGNDDARAEGVYAAPHRGRTCGFFETGIDQCFGCEFRHLWNRINGPRGIGWDTNPWVWAISFRSLAAAALERAA